ncbi:hypothetical protein BSKO_05315 [Bryopsis sp. KO-2023]|nr:hypothetical protein BSKO_05315 [Bryopsis sp. KO-2023]
MQRSQSGTARPKNLVNGESGEVDGALQEARAKIVLLKQQLAELSDAFSYASDGSRDNPLDTLPEGNNRITDKPTTTRYPSDASGASSKSRGSKGSRNVAMDPPPSSLFYKGITNETSRGNISPRRIQMEPQSGAAKGNRGNRIDEARSVSVNSEASSGPKIVSPFARFSDREFERGIDVDEEAEEQRQAAIARDVSRCNGGRDEDESDDDTVFHSPRTDHFRDHDSQASSKRDYRSPSPDDAAIPQTPVRSGEALLNAGARMHSEPLLFDDPMMKSIAMNSGEANPHSGDSRGSSHTLYHEQGHVPLPTDGVHQSGVGPAPAYADTDDDFESDAIAWILFSLGSYISWPGKDKRHSQFGAHLQSRFGVPEMDLPVYPVPKVSSGGKTVREAIAKLWSEGGVYVVEELWEMIAGIIESQEVNKGLDAQSSWLSGRSLHCAADGLPFAFTVHTFSAPGMPCTVGRANVSAEVCSSDMSRAPQCIASGDKKDEEAVEVPQSPRADMPEADIRKSLSGQLVNGHIIGTHSSLEQKPAVVVDKSLMRQSSADIKKSMQAEPESEEMVEVSLNPRKGRSRTTEDHVRGLQQQQPFTPRRGKGDEIFSFHSGSSKGSRAERSDKPGKSDPMATADLTAFIRGPDDAVGPALGKHPYEGRVDSDEFETADLSIFRDGAASIGTESESLSFHNRGGSASMTSNEQIDTADLSGFVRPRADRLAPVDEAEKISSQGESTQPHGPPSFAAVDLVWEVRYVKAGDHSTAVIEMCLSPTEPEEEEVNRTWETYPGDSDSEASATGRTDEAGGTKPGHSSKRSVDMDILRSVSLKGFLANQAEQRKNSRRKMNVEPVAEIESVGSASSRKQETQESGGGGSRAGRPPLPRTSKGSGSDGERPKKKPPVASGSRKELLAKEQRKAEKAQKKARLPKFSKLVRRIRSLVGSGRGGKTDYASNVLEETEAVDRGCQSERFLPRPEHELRATRSAQLIVGRHDEEDEEEEVEKGSEGQKETQMLRQLSIESIHPEGSGSQAVVPHEGGLESPGSSGLEMVVAHHDPNAAQDAFWGFPRSVSLPVKDLGNGQYLIMGHLAGEGLYEISVKVGGKHVLESPIRFRVVPPRSLGSGITPDGPFYPHRDLPYFPSQTTPLSPHPTDPPCHSVSYDAERLEYARQHPHIGCVDLVFAVDATASMTAELEELPNVIKELSGLIGEVHLCKRVRFAVVAYRDHWPEDDHAFVLSKLDFTEDVEKVCNFIRSLEASGGGDYPEAVEAALIEAAEGVSWWPFSSRLVIWVGDAPPHGYEGMGPKQALEHEEAFLQAKQRVKKAAAAVHHAVRSGTSTDWNQEDAELKEALAGCDKLAMYYDNFPLGVPGGVRWEEAAVRLSSIGARVIAIGLRDAIFHAPSQACLRSIAHLTGGALLEVGNLEGSVVGPLTTAIVEQLLDQQLVEEEVCDLMICCRVDLKRRPPTECMKIIIDTMNRAEKLPHRLQVLPAESTSGEEGLGEQVLPILPTDGSNERVSQSDSTLPVDGWKGGVGQSLLLGMQTVELHDKILEQFLKGIRSKAESVGLALQAGFGSRSSWLETLGSGLGDVSQSQGRRAHKRIAEEVLTSPVSLRYLLAEKCVAEMLGKRAGSRQDQ